mmetsp:Transcript_63546/g.71162  ORF Transcript_63546/g.71162 Transcript_63546/m.71162 type:complete len:487 (-) Transcript_63546:394-1854(-)
MMKEKKNNRIVAYFSTSSSTSGGQLPSLLDTTTDVNSKVSSSKQQQKKKRRQSNNIRRRQQQRCSKVFEISKRLLVYGIALAAIASSVLSIFSCNFFSYTDSVVATDGVDGFTSALENDTNMNEVDLGYQYTPFEFMNEAGVGLFAYYMGDPSEEGSILYKQEPMCFLYCDELHDFYWFSNNYNPGNKRLLTRKIDLWIVARYCSIIAPSVALWGLLQLIAVENWFCGCRLNIVTHTATVTSSLVLFVTFLSASLIQFGTFSIMLASPNLSSPSQSDGTTYQDSFCFSTTTTSSNKYLCRIDTGGFYALGSGLVYLVLAVYSSLSTYSNTPTTQSSATEDGNDDGPNNNNNENTDDTNNTRSLICCGGCCLRRGDGNSSSGTHNRARKGGINNNNNNNDDDDQKAVSSKSKRVAAGDAKVISETSDSSNNSSSNSTSTSKLISKLSYHDEEEHHDEEEQHDADDKDEDEVRSGGASFSFFGSEITF